MNETPTVQAPSEEPQAVSAVPDQPQNEPQIAPQAAFDSFAAQANEPQRESNFPPLDTSAVNKVTIDAPQAAEFTQTSAPVPDPGLSPQAIPVDHQLEASSSPEKLSV